MKNILYIILALVLSFSYYTFEKHQKTERVDRFIEHRIKVAKNELNIHKRLDDFVVIEDIYIERDNGNGIFYSKYRDIYIDLIVTDSHFADTIIYEMSKNNIQSIEKIQEKYKKEICRKIETRALIEVEYVKVANISFMYQGDKILTFSVKKSDCRF